MTIIVTSAVGVSRVVQRLTRIRPEQVRLTRFRRTRLGRRGLAEEQVYAFVRRIADELVARDATEAALREENLRLKAALRAWHAEHSHTRATNAGHWTDRERAGGHRRSWA